MCTFTPGSAQCCQSALLGSCTRIFGSIPKALRGLPFHFCCPGCDGVTILPKLLRPVDVNPVKRSGSAYTLTGHFIRYSVVAPGWTLFCLQNHSWHRFYKVLETVLRQFVPYGPYHLNVAAKLETHQTRQRFSNLLLSKFGGLLQMELQFPVLI